MIVVADESEGESSNASPLPKSKAQPLSAEDAARERPRPSLSEFVIPVFAIAAVIAVLLPQILDHYATETIIYGALLGVPLLLLAVVAFAQVAVRHWRCSAHARVSRRARHYGQLLLLIAATAALIYFIDTIGYLLGLALYLVFIGRMFYRRSWTVLLLLTFCTVGLIHFVFVVEFQLQLPPGFIGKLG